MEDLQMLKKNWIYKRGDIYLADFGTPAGSVQGGFCPVINIQNNTGSQMSTGWYISYALRRLPSAAK